MLLELQNVSVKVNKQVYLEDINLSFKAGEFNVLLGRTLAGKTSLLRVIAGLDKLSQGKILCDGEDISERPIQKRNVAMVYQQFINYPHFTVWENIASPLTLAKVPLPEITRRVNDIAELLHIGPFLHKYPLALSGGQQQRCAMARALVKDSQFILFDEPLVNLDYKLRETLRFELKALFKRRNSIAIYATTEAQEALALGGNTTLLHEGRVMQSGKALVQYYQPVNLHAANLFNEPPMNEFEINIGNDGLQIPGQASIPKTSRFINISDGHYRFAVRPNNVHLVSTGEPEVCMQAHVDLAEISASETYLHVRVVHSKLTIQNWVVHLQGIHQFANSQSLTLFIALTDMFVFDSAGHAISWPLNPYIHGQQANASYKPEQVN